MADHAPATGGDHNGFRVGKGVYRGQVRDTGDRGCSRGGRGKEDKEKNGKISVYIIEHEINVMFIQIAINNKVLKVMCRSNPVPCTGYC